MATVAADFTLKRRFPMGVRRYEITGKFTGPASYAAGGEAITETMLKAIGSIRTVEHFALTPLLDGTFANAKTSAFDKNVSGSTAGKIHFYEATGAEVAGAVNLSTFTCQFRLVGY